MVARYLELKAENSSHSYLRAREIAKALHCEVEDIFTETKGAYDDMASNEWWIADNHTFDIITMGANGKRAPPVPDGIL